MHPPTLLLLAVASITITSSIVQAAPVHQWSARFGDAEYQDGLSVALDGLGNTIITGAFEGTVDFGGGPLTSEGNIEAYVAKFDPAGNHLWSQRFGGPDGGATVRCVTTDAAGNIFVTGDFGGTVDFGGGPLFGLGDIFVVKLDANGTHLWSKGFGDDDDFQFGTSVATDGSGNLVLTGSIKGIVDFGGGPLPGASDYDVFIAKFDANGNHLFSKRFGDAEDQYGASVATDGSGNSILTGTFLGAVDFGGGPLTSAGAGDIYVTKFGAEGTHLWSHRFGDSDPQNASSVASDASGSVLITGDFTGTVDFGGGPLVNPADESIFVAKFAANGSHLWSQQFGDESGQYGFSIAADGSSNVLITGLFDGALDFGGGPIASAGWDVYIAILDTNGNHLWSAGFGDRDNQQQGNSIAAGVSGNFALTGSFNGTLDFGGGPLTNPTGFTDIFVANFVNGDPVPVLIPYFEAIAVRGVVQIRWEVWSDEALESFALYRRDDGQSQAAMIAEDSPYPMARSFIDEHVEPGRTYRYKLRLHTLDGDDIRSPVATVTIPWLATSLGQNHPNPFKPSTTIEYTLTERSRAVLRIYDVTGKLVLRMDQGVRDYGTHHVEWDGRDAAGRSVGSGIYYYQLEGAPHLGSRKMVLLN